MACNKEAQQGRTDKEWAPALSSMAPAQQGSKDRRWALALSGTAPDSKALALSGTAPDSKRILRTLSACPRIQG